MPNVLPRWRMLLSSVLLGLAVLAQAPLPAQAAGSGALQKLLPGQAAADTAGQPAVESADSSAGAESWQAGARRVGALEVELVADARQVVPGETFRVGLRLRHDPHWHTYWRNPGDTGFPTRFDLQGPAGTAYSDIVWPVPERLAIGPLANYGYEGETLIYRDVTLPEDCQ